MNTASIAEIFCLFIMKTSTEGHIICIISKQQAFGLILPEKWERGLNRILFNDSGIRSIKCISPTTYKLGLVKGVYTLSDHHIID